MLALPCCRRCCGSLDWYGGGAEGASAIGSEEPPLTALAAVCGGREGGGGERVRGACPPPTCRPSAEASAEAAGRIDVVAMRGCSGPLKCGSKHQGATMQVALPGGMAGGSRGAGSASVAPVVAEACTGTGSGLSPPHAGGGEKGSAAPPPVSCCPAPPWSPRVARLGTGRFAGLGSSVPRAEEVRGPSPLGSAARRRAAGGPGSGRACDAGHARPNQVDNAAAPARRASGTSTWRDPGRDSWANWARRGANMAFAARPGAAADAPAPASAPGARRRPMFQAERALCAAACPSVGGCVAEPRAGRCGLAPAGASGHTVA